MTLYSLLIADALGINSSEREAIRLGALLHDIGKIGVSDTILRKRGSLTEDEWGEMRKHPTWGKQIIGEIEFVRRAVDIIYAHHEKLNGSGYPRGLRGSEIPLGARIFAVADAFDALTMERPYKAAVAPEVARDEIVNSANFHFDPEVVAAFLSVYPQILKAMQASHPTLKS